MQHLLGSLVVLLHPTLVQASLEVYTWIPQVFQRWEWTSTTELRAVPACISLGEVAPLVEPNPTSLRPCLDLPRWGETFSAPRNTHSHTLLWRNVFCSGFSLYHLTNPRRTTSNHRTKHYKFKYGLRLASRWKVLGKYICFCLYPILCLMNVNHVWMNNVPCMLLWKY